MSNNLFVMPDPQQCGLGFPESLAAKYRPKHMDDFIGLAEIRKKIAAFVARPYPADFMFVGGSGLGKTSMGEVMAAMIPAEHRLVPSRKCDLDTVEEISRRCWFMPWEGKRMHLVQVEEADEMTEAAKLAFLSKLDPANHPPNTVFVFTCNSTDRFEPRFLSRCRVFEFSSYGMSQHMAAYLEKVWKAEIGGRDAKSPNFARIVKDSSSNLRDALMKLEVELLGV